MSQTRRAYIRQIRTAEFWRRARLAVLALLVVIAWWLTSCSPLTAYEATATPTAAATAAVNVSNWTQIPAPRLTEHFLYHNAGDWTLILTAPGRKAAPQVKE